MVWVLAAIAGWCGTGWPIRFPWPGGGGGGGSPDDPWPDNCPVCGMVIGAIMGVIIWEVVGRQLAPDASLLEIAAVGFLGGSFGSSLVTGVMRLGSRNKVTTRVNA